MEGWGLRSLTDESSFAAHWCEMPPIDMAQFDRLLDERERQLPAWAEVYVKKGSDNSSSDNDEDTDADGERGGAEDEGDDKEQETEEKVEASVLSNLERPTAERLTALVERAFALFKNHVRYGSSYETCKECPQHCPDHSGNEEVVSGLVSALTARLVELWDILEPHSDTTLLSIMCQLDAITDTIIEQMGTCEKIEGIEFQPILHSLGMQWLTQILSTVRNREEETWRIPLSVMNAVRILCMLKKFVHSDSAFFEAVMLLSEPTLEPGNEKELVISPACATQMSATREAWYKLERKLGNHDQALRVARFMEREDDRNKCIMETLISSGRPDEAFEFLDAMPMSALPVILQLAADVQPSSPLEGFVLAINICKTENGSWKATGFLEAAKVIPKPPPPQPSCAVLDWGPPSLLASCTRKVGQVLDSYSSRELYRALLQLPDELHASIMTAVLAARYSKDNADTIFQANVKDCFQSGHSSLALATLIGNARWYLGGGNRYDDTPRVLKHAVDTAIRFDGEHLAAVYRFLKEILRGGISTMLSCFFDTIFTDDSVKLNEYMRMLLFNDMIEAVLNWPLSDILDWEYAIGYSSRMNEYVTIPLGRIATSSTPEEQERLSGVAALTEHFGRFASLVGGRHADTEPAVGALKQIYEDYVRLNREYVWREQLRSLTQHGCRTSLWHLHNQTLSVAQLREFIREQAEACGLSKWLEGNGLEDGTPPGHCK